MFFKNVLEKEFWEARSREAEENKKLPYQAIYHTHEDDWNRVQTETKEILEKELQKDSLILDAGCGIGSLVEILPPRINYIGIDLCPHFIKIAKKNHPSHSFFVMDFNNLSSFSDDAFDVVVLRSIEQMMKGNTSLWEVFEAKFTRISKKLLIIEYTSGESLHTINHTSIRKES